jgi:ABC-type oligopeptide transport system substrate-binding subunit
MDAAAVTGDQSKRALLLGQAEQVLLRELPILPIYFGVAKNALRPDPAASAAWGAPTASGGMQMAK